jgi:hypothetical protein
VLTEKIKIKKIIIFNFYLYTCEICKVDTFGHPPIVHSASNSWIRVKRSDSLEYRNVCAMRAGIFVVQKFASIFLSQLDSSVKRLVLKCFDCTGTDFLVRLVKRVGMVHVFFAVKMSILRHHNPFAGAANNGASRVR